MHETLNLDADNNTASIQTHLSLVQNVIQRMSANSSMCKSWSVTLVSAILVIVADKGKPEYAWIALLPTIIFALLDSYYLSLEKGFRETYNDFVRKFHSNNLHREDFYAINPMGSKFKNQYSAFFSLSVWGFYFPLGLLIFVTKNIAIG